MASESRKAFDGNVKDIERLLEIHSDYGGNTRGRRYQLEVLNKSAIVLITSFWEAYCEDLAGEALEHLVLHLGDSTGIPKEVRKQIVKDLTNDTNDLAVWKLADDGWRQVLQDRFDELQEQRNRRLNSPKWENIDDLFLKAVGIKGVSKSWRWEGMSVAKARTKLNEFVKLRGEIAHRGSSLKTCQKKDVLDYFAFIKKIVAKTGGRVKSHVKKSTGEDLW